MPFRIALDAHGGDAGIAPNIAAALAAAEDDNVSVVVVGNADTIQQALPRRAPRRDRVTVVHAAQQIGMGEAAVQSVRRKTDNSISVAMSLLKRGEVDGVVSAGHSGALVASALITLGRLPGVSRPALGTCFPTPGPPTFFLDIGAVVDPKPDALLQFGYLGAAYAEHVLGIHRPTVALLSNGEETSKGNALTREARELFDGAALDYVGYVEGRELLTHPAAVIVTDGFTGNIALKTAEGTAKAIQAILKHELLADARSKLGSAILRPALQRIRGHMDYDRIGGAPLLGVDGVVIAAHGSAPAGAIANAIRTAAFSARIRLPELLRDAIPDDAKTGRQREAAEALAT